MSGPSCASVHHVTIPVTDLDESVGRHQTVLKAEREWQGATQEQTTPICDQLTTPRTTTGFMAAG
jgi:hypothetical protein